MTAYGTSSCEHLALPPLTDRLTHAGSMFATYLANTIVFVVGTTTEIEIPIGFSVAFACVLANRLCLNTRGMIRRTSSFSTLSTTEPPPSSHDAYSYPSRHAHTNDDSESWEDGLDSEDAEYAEYDGYGYGSGELYTMSTPARSPRTVEGGERLDAIQMRELRRMRSSRRLGGGLGERWGRGRWIGRREAGCESVGVVTV